MRIDLHPKQAQALLSSGTEILYGGAAGGGKSFFLRVVSIMAALEVPGVQVYLFRKNYPDLRDNHLTGPTSYHALLHSYVQHGHVKFNQLENQFNFKNGSAIKLRHLNTSKDLQNYQGSEFHLLLVDECTHFLEHEYRFLRSRVRMAGIEVKSKYFKNLPKIILSANPGGVGHQWVKQSFIDPAPFMQIWKTPPDEGGFMRQYIPARLEDNPSLTESDPNYRDRLAGLGNPNLVRAMMDGDWDVVAGAAFERLNRDDHCLRPFNPPSHWTRFVAMDWGTAKPFAVLWFCVAEGHTVLAAKGDWPEQEIPDGAVILYREFYGWNGNADQGCRMESTEVADRILEIEDEAGEPKIDYRVADSAMWSKTDGPSPIERMFKQSEGRLNFRPAEKDRAMNYQEVRARIAGDDGVPMFYATENCTHFWRTVPTLQLDEVNPDKGPDSRMEDHIYDALAYGLRSRPYVRTERQRQMQKWNENRKLAGLNKSYTRHSSTKVKK